MAALFFVFALALFVPLEDISPQCGLSRFLSAMYSLDKPIFRASMGGRPIRALFVVIILVVFLAILAVGCFAGSFLTDRRRILADKVVIALVSVYLLYIISQTLGQIFYLRSCMEDNHRRTVNEKYASLLGPVFNYSITVRQTLLEQKHFSCQFLTDKDLSRDPGMLDFRIIAYFLYPVDLRNIRAEEQDCLVVYDKKNATQFVPADYRIVQKFDDRHLVAVRQDSL